MAVLDNDGLCRSVTVTPGATRGVRADPRGVRSRNVFMHWPSAGAALNELATLHACQCATLTWAGAICPCVAAAGRRTCVRTTLIFQCHCQRANSEMTLKTYRGPRLVCPAFLPSMLRLACHLDSGSRADKNNYCAVQEGARLVICGTRPPAPLPMCSN
ncbi:hypothetical protein DENSPDRAFT_654421 [Dentipellis sp. KUC8613]|nr:hypothetical protein DENSPDRAFT_654421 [Dentipellis sp. KUC8613]